MIHNSKSSAANILPADFDPHGQDFMDFGRKVMETLDYEPNQEQITLIAAFAHFLANSDSRTVFLLNGYAGTGKTSMAGAIVRVLSQCGVKTVLLAPTGRAAKVFSEYSRHTAYTIHRRIYRQNGYLQEGFQLAENRHTDTLFIVDEASMIANSSAEGSMFGTGHLLDDLVRYVYGAHGCRLMFMGDAAQLPPVGQTGSPALSVDALQSYGLTVYALSLTSIARQAQESGVLYNATLLRQAMQNAAPGVVPELELERFDDIGPISGEFLREAISDCYDRDGIDNTIIVTRSNRSATLYNMGVRNSILYREEALTPDDMLIVAKNNYFWSADVDDLDFIANGDVLQVVRVWGDIECRYGLRFANVTVRLPDRSDTEIDVKVITDSLVANTPSLSREQSEALYQGVLSELTGDRRERYRKLKADPYFNALQVKYAYAVTCHKAQGGQWSNVFVDMGGIRSDALTTLDFYRWLYTAITRARKHVWLINYSAP